MITFFSQTQGRSHYYEVNVHHVYSMDTEYAISTLLAILISGNFLKIAISICYRKCSHISRLARRMMLYVLLMYSQCIA